MELKLLSLPKDAPASASCFATRHHLTPTTDLGLVPYVEAGEPT